MKNVSLLTFLTQLGLGVVLPLAGFTLLGVWLRHTFSLGIWVVVLLVTFGVVVAVQGFRSTLKAMEHLAKDQDEEKPPLAYNEHD